MKKPINILTHLRCIGQIVLIAFVTFNLVAESMNLLEMDAVEMAQELDAENETEDKTDTNEGEDSKICTDLGFFANANTHQATLAKDGFPHLNVDLDIPSPPPDRV